MSSNNTRINVDADTSRAKNALRELSDEAKKYNIDASKTSGGDPNELKKVIGEIRKEKSKSISDEYSIIRNEATTDFSKAKRELSSGKISEKEFEKKRGRYEESMVVGKAEERDELRQINETTNKLLEDILKHFESETKQDDQKSQRDTSEFDSKVGKFASGRECECESESERAEKCLREPSDIDNEETSKRLFSMSNLKSGNSAARLLQGAGGAVQNLENGDLMGAGTSLLSKAGPWGLAAAGIVGAAGGLFMASEKLEKNMGSLFAIRAQGDKEKIFNDLESRSKRASGLDNDEVLKISYDIAKTSGFGGNDLIGRAMSSHSLQKGYGIDNVSQYSANERQDLANQNGYTRSMNDNIVEMLNTLVSIKGGTIKADDLTRANEKVALLFKLQSNYGSRQDTFNNKDIINVIAGFEKFGMKGNQDQFIEGTLGSFKESGDQNKRLMQLSFAAKSHPELAGDYAGLSEIVEKGTDSSYLGTGMKEVNRLGGKNKQTSYAFSKWFYEGLNVDQRKALMGDKTGEVSETILGKMSTGSGFTKDTFSIKDAEESAKNNTTITDSITSSLKNGVAEMGTNMVKGISDLFSDGKAVVTVKSDKISIINKNNYVKK